MTKKQPYSDFFDFRKNCPYDSNEIRIAGIGASQKEKDLSRLLYRICGSVRYFALNWIFKTPKGSPLQFLQKLRFLSLRYSADFRRSSLLRYRYRLSMCFCDLWAVIRQIWSTQSCDYSGSAPIGCALFHFDLHVVLWVAGSLLSLQFHWSRHLSLSLYSTCRDLRQFQTLSDCNQIRRCCGGLRTAQFHCVLQSYFHNLNQQAGTGPSRRRI